MIEFKNNKHLLDFFSMNLPLKVIQSIIISVKTYEHKMIEIGNKNEEIINKDKWNFCHHFPILSLLGVNHHLPLLHKYKSFICLEETSDRINEF